MAGVLQSRPTVSAAERRMGRINEFISQLRNARAFLLIVILPTLLTAIYLYAIASDQYESSADFVVRKSDTPSTGEGVGQLLGFSVSNLTGSSDAYVVEQYLLSHNAVDKLRAQNGLVAMFRHQGIDIFDRLWSADPTPESLLKYFRKQVSINADETTGITHLSVRTFRPEDSLVLARKLLAMGEEQVNAINARTYADAVKQAQHNFEEANHRLSQIETQLTNYRREREDIDPAETTKAKIAMISGLTGNLTIAQARLQAMRATISINSPQYQAMKHQVQTLQAQVNAHADSIAGGEHSTANHLGEYEKLMIRRQETAQIFAAADIQLQQARAEAKRQQLYLIRVVEPNLPVKSEFPQRAKILFTVFASLFFAYAIGWLLWAGVKEHAM